MLKYPKFLQVLALAAVVTTSIPLTDASVHASDSKETPKEYEARTEYSLPEGYHYVLSDGKYVVFAEDGKVKIEKDEAKKAEVKKAEPKKAEVKKAELEKTEEKKAEPEKTEEKEAPEKAEPEKTEEKKAESETAEPKKAEEKNEEKSEDEKAEPATGELKKAEEKNEESSENSGREIITTEDSVSDSGNSGREIIMMEDNAEESGAENPDESGETPDSGNPDGENPGGSGETPDGGNPDGENPGGSIENPDEENPGGSIENPDEENPGGSIENPDEENPGGSIENPDEENPDGIPGQPGGVSGSETDNTEGIRNPGETGAEMSARDPKAEETQNKVSRKKIKKTDRLKPREVKKTFELDYEASKPFSQIGERICYNVEVPIEGLPPFITQEMVVGALKTQDETGYPASVTIAQIINESGYGKYGPGGENGQGLSYLAYQYCNLFGIKGTGTAGSARMNTKEMTPGGQTYSIQAGFRAYNTYMECIEDRSELLTKVYSDLTENVTDANTFAVRIGGRWATGIHYGENLIDTMETYDLYRLDDMTLIDFSKMIGTFANPCPGSRVTSNFGYRSFDNKFHKGIDLGTGSQNIPTYAAEAGTVMFAGSAGNAGNLITIDHGDGLVTKYMHHSQIYVKLGQKVEKGQQIGLSGTTGRSTGNHLHFQIEKYGVALDPSIYLMKE